MRKSHISMLVDRSATMASFPVDVVATINSYVRQAQKDTRSQTRLSIVMFDGEAIETVRDRLPVNQCLELAPQDYRPRGATPLFDAVGNTIALHDCLSDKDERRVMTILTHGVDTASHEFTHDAVLSLIDHKQRQEGWLFHYLAVAPLHWRVAAAVPPRTKAPPINGAHTVVDGPMPASRSRLSHTEERARGGW